MATPRAVRIPRTVSSPLAEPSLPSVRTRAESTVDRRANTAGTQRAVRLTLVYLLALGLLYLAFVVYARSTPYGRTPGTEWELLVFGFVAVFLGLVGAVLSLTPAPRRVEVSKERVVVVGRWGRRVEWPSPTELSVRVVRRHLAGGLSRDPVESVEVQATGRRARTYLVEQGLFSPAEPRP